MKDEMAQAEQAVFAALGVPPEYLKTSFTPTPYTNNIDKILVHYSAVDSVVTACLVRVLASLKTKEELPYMDSFSNPDALRPYFDASCGKCNSHMLMTWMTNPNHTLMLEEIHNRTRGLYRIHMHGNHAYLIDYPYRDANGFYKKETVRSGTSLSYALGIVMKKLTDLYGLGEIPNLLGKAT